MGTWVLAVLAPVAVLFTAAAALMLVGGAGPASPPDELLRIRSELAGQDPELVLVGNSMVEAAVDAQALGAALEIEGGAQTVYIPSTTAPVWYALLRNHVFGAGLSPRVVVVAGSLKHLLTLDPGSEAAWAQFRGLLTEHEPVLFPKVLGQSQWSMWWGQLRTSRTHVHRQLLDHPADAAAALAGALQGRPEDDGAALRAGASATVFADDQVDNDLHQRVIPVVEQEGDGAGPAQDPDGATTDSLLDDLIELCRAHGARLVVVHLPVAPESRHRHRLGPDARRTAQAQLQSGGAGYLAFDGLDLPASHYKDQRHLSKIGRAALTQMLAASLHEMAVLGDGPMQATGMPLDSLPMPVATRVGASPIQPVETTPLAGAECELRAKLGPLNPLSPKHLKNAGLPPLSPIQVLVDGQPLAPASTLAELGTRCRGEFAVGSSKVRISPPGTGRHAYALALAADLPLESDRGDQAWWVYPGTSVVVRYPGTAEAGLASLRVTAQIQTVGEAVGVPHLSVGGQEKPLEGDGPTRTAHLDLGPLQTELEVVLAVPEDGPFVLIQSVELQVDKQRFSGPWPALAAAQAGGSVGFGIKGQNPRSWKGPPPAVEPDGPPVFKAGSWRFTVADLTAISDTEVTKRTSFKGCSPLRVLVDGVPLSNPGARCKRLRADLLDASCHSADQLLFRLPDDGSPLEGESRVTLALDPERTCGGRGMWMYPQDVLTVRPRASDLRKLSQPGAWLTISATEHGGKAPLRAALLAGDHTLDTVAFPPETLDRTPRCHKLAQALPAGAKDPRVALERGDGWTIVWNVAVFEGPPPDCAE